MDRHGHDRFIPCIVLAIAVFTTLRSLLRMGAHGCVGADLDAAASPLTEKSPHE